VVTGSPVVVDPDPPLVVELVDVESAPPVELVELVELVDVESAPPVELAESESSAELDSSSAGSSLVPLSSWSASPAESSELEMLEHPPAPSAQPRARRRKTVLESLMLYGLMGRGKAPLQRPRAAKTAFPNCTSQNAM